MYNCIEDATRLARHLKHMYVTPEHVLYALSMNDNFVSAFRSCGGSIQELKGSIRNYFSTYLKTSEYKGDPDLSASMKKALEIASRYAKGSNRDDVGIADIMYGISQSSESYACYYIAIQHVDCDELIYKLQNPIEDKNEESEEEDDSNTSDNTLDKKGIIELLRKQLGIPEGVAFTVEGPITGLFPPFLPFKGGTGNNMGDATGSRGTANSDGNDVEDWKKLVTNLNEAVKSRKEPLVGREDIIERTIQILCRKYKSNVIHIGEPGVGKTAITMGLARQINEGNVPEQLQGATIYSIDMGSLLAGTMFRGQFEQRIEAIMNGLEQEEKPIAYIDEIHTIIGAGASSDGAIDASNMIKRRLTEGKIRFIGSTTYEEYKKYIEKDKALNRRFKAIEVREASVAETIEILNGIKKCYEGYHNVVFTGDAIKSAAELADKYINEKFMPDKAIDLLDEAGAYVASHRKGSSYVKVGRDTIETVLSASYNIPKQNVEGSEVKNLRTLDGRLKCKVFGQDTAIDELVRCIKMSRAGLNDDNKPVASMLFVGPTGTGKTEVAKQLANETGVKLIRFDMSEYQEKYTVSKLIGSPAGYVGYDEGGLLTETIRKNPHCVLLLDEIEKAHPDIYNMLLQIMDDATLTDNQGRKADFRNVTLIMTSNAGARDMGRKKLGFGSDDGGIDHESVNSAVKLVFSPEFRNRLTKVVVFNQIDDDMAIKIAERQLNELKCKLKDKGIKLSITKKCYKEIATRGTSIDTGAREIKRIIDSEVKPMFVDNILFGDLKDGGKCRLDYTKDKFKLAICE